MIAYAISVVGITGYYFERKKFIEEFKRRLKREEELTKRAYETVVLKEIGDRIGYSLDASKIVEIISGSLGKLLEYSTVAYIIIGEKEEKLRFSCTVFEPVNSQFIGEVKMKILTSYSEITDRPVTQSELDESITGMVLDEQSTNLVSSFFNLPVVISGKLVGIINVASWKKDLYNSENTAVIYRIARLASDSVSRLREVLENEKSRLIQAVQALSDGLMMVDTKNRLIFANRKLCQFLGLDGNPTFLDIVSGLSGHLDLRTVMENVIAIETESTPQEIVIQDRVLQVFASKVLDKKSQQVMGVVVLFHDVTDAKSLDRLRRDFTAMMVHELRAPLTSIKSTVEVLKSDMNKIKPEEIDKYLTTVDMTSQSMLELVNDLLDVSKLEAGKFDVICEDGDVGEVVAERIEVFRPQVAMKNLKLTLEVEKNLPQGYFDKIRIKQVMNNLFSNAVKFTDRGEIRVNVTKEVIDGRPVDILVSVADTGIGIEPDQIITLFSKFGQLIGARRKAGLKSSGLGLFIAKGIIEAWGGKIWVKSEGPSLGSTFYFTIPIADLAIQGKFDQVEKIPIISKIAQA